MARRTLRFLSGSLVNHFHKSTISKFLGREVHSYAIERSNYRIRNITEEDIPKKAEIRKSLNLHDCESSLYSFHKLDPEAFIVAEDDKGNIIATDLMITYKKDFYVWGALYVHKEYRKINLSMEISNIHRLRHKDRMVICFAAIRNGWAWPQKLRALFNYEAGYIANRYVSVDNVDVTILSDDLPQDVSIHSYEKAHLDLMHDYDSSVAGYKRRRFLELSCNEPNTKTMVALKRGKCVGFGTIKLSCPGAKRVGPLYSDDPKIAEALLKSLMKGYQRGTGIAIVVPCSNKDAQKLVAKLNVPVNDDLLQLYDKGFPEADLSKAYAHFDINGASI